MFTIGGMNKPNSLERIALELNGKKAIILEIYVFVFVEYA